MLTINQAVREALKTVADPESESTDKIVAIARAKLVQGGNRKDTVTPQSVYNQRRLIRVKMNVDRITPKTVADYEKKVAQDPKVARHVLNGHARSTVLIPTEQPSTPDAGVFLRAKDFIRSAGGLSQAIAFLEQLRECIS